MKTLKFREHLSKLISSGEKNTTLRLFDDKDLSEGDVVSFLIKESLKEFAKAELTNIKETTLGELTDEDWGGHEKFDSEEEMYKTYSEYSGCPVDKNTSVKIIKFDLI